ncbi:hypothetical protein PQR72_27650 [Paraburkholderia madseniana]|uniref:hypothetical protein n=1 Tax=Paraburkholderia madseniana TaxID=2599607 RepID=UPI0015C544A0|nr:hypothetical protein [Paraburkholderia madseniana]NPT68072.1 hypothetical protein [Paraburkholderia madseniana]
MPINPIYKKLVQGPDDTVGALAYALYKQRKVAYITEIQSAENRPLTSEEIGAFQRQNASDDQIKAYKKEAATLASEFLNAALASKLADAEDEAKNNVREAALRSEIKAMGQEIAELRKRLEEKRTVGGWLQDAFGNLMVNVVTILLIGLAVIGLKAIDKLSTHTESTIGIGDESPANASRVPATNEPSTAPHKAASQP